MLQGCMSVSVSHWLIASRPKTLGAAVAPVMAGSVLGWKLGGEFCGWLLLATLGSCMCLQVATNFFNDAVDGLKGSDTEERLGPKRITASGLVPARTVLLGAGVMLGLAVLLAAPLVWYRGWPMVAIGVPSLWFCYGYTGGPWPLAYRGLGELFVVLFFGLVAVTGSAFVQSGEWHVEAVVLGLQIGLLSTVLIAINNLRDVMEDAQTGKRTLAVRLGKSFAKWEIWGLHVVALLLGIYWWYALDWRWAMTWPAVPVLVLGERINRGVAANEPSEVYNKFLAMAGASLLLFSAVWCWAVWRG
jgi:1,4-dihydroxy-2-naphthoate octaprenyltransferase